MKPYFYILLFLFGLLTSCSKDPEEFSLWGNIPVVPFSISSTSDTLMQSDTFKDVAIQADKSMNYKGKQYNISRVKMIAGGLQNSNDNASFQNIKKVEVWFSDSVNGITKAGETDIFTDSLFHDIRFHATNESLIKEYFIKDTKIDLIVKYALIHPQQDSIPAKLSLSYMVYYNKD